MSEDLELVAMSTVSGALSSLDESAKGRVLRWAAERYGVGFASMQRGEASERTDNFTSASESLGSADKDYAHFAELFAAAGPSKESDKALVAAYWVQVVKGDDSWSSRSLNAELKNLGHGIANISHALQRYIERRPQLVIQLKKSGITRQATKTYKVTAEGIKYVQGLLNSGGD